MDGAIRAQSAAAAQGRARSVEMETRPLLCDIRKQPPTMRQPAHFRVRTKGTPWHAGRDSGCVRGAFGSTEVRGEPDSGQRRRPF